MSVIMPMSEILQNPVIIPVFPTVFYLLQLLSVVEYGRPWDVSRLICSISAWVSVAQVCTCVYVYMYVYMYMYVHMHVCTCMCSNNVMKNGVRMSCFKTSLYPPKHTEAL